MIANFLHRRMTGVYFWDFIFTVLIIYADVYSVDARPVKERADKVGKFSCAKEIAVKGHITVNKLVILNVLELY